MRVAYAWMKPCILYIHTYSGVRVIASHILFEISLLIGEVAIKGTYLTLNAHFGP